MPKLVARPELRILDFDIETRLVGFYEAGRFKPKGSEPTAIGFSFEGSDLVEAFVQPDWSVPELLSIFRAAYAEADIVTGHYIRKFDLPILNGAMFEHGLPLLEPKLVIDTKVDLKDIEGLSKSQENLADMLRVADEKKHMSDSRWRDATRLTEDGVKATFERVTMDVIQHKALRAALNEAGALNAPTIWKP